MTVKGKVISVEGDFATVEVRRRAMCDGCPNDTANRAPAGNNEADKNTAPQSSCGHSCAMGALLGDRKNMNVSVKNTLGAQRGDTVELESPDRTVLSSAFLVFILPLILAFGFWFVADRIFDKELYSYIAAACGFALSLAICAAVEKRTEKTGAKIIMKDIVFRAAGE